MDWKYKHFAQEAIFQAEREVVYDAVRALAGDWLAGWKVSETSDGLEARGRSAGHVAIANFRFEPAAGGTRVAVALQVERASPLGFMLADIGGYYDRQIRKWLQALPWWVQQRQATATPSEGQPDRAVPAAPRIPKPSRGADFFVVCVIFFLTVFICVYTISAIVGLLTGNLYLAARGGGGGMIHGLGARILSATILVLFGWIAFRIWKPKRRNRGSGWLPPP
jgi:hypothetical protein